MRPRMTFPGKGILPYTYGNPYHQPSLAYIIHPHRRCHKDSCLAHNKSPGPPAFPQAILLSAWAPSTITTYMQSLHRLIQLAREFSTLSTWSEFYAQAASLSIQRGYSSSSIKAILSAAKFLYHLGLVPSAPTPSHWLYAKAAVRLYNSPSTQIWGSPAWFTNLGAVCSSVENKITLSLAILSFTLALRASEAAAITVQDLTHLLTSSDFRFSLAKRSPPHDSCTRPLLPFPKRWALYLLHLLHSSDPPRYYGPVFPSVNTLHTQFRHLREQTSLPTFSWHTWRRTCARAMYYAGAPHTFIQWWCRWESTTMSTLYVGDPSESPSDTTMPWFFPVPPAQSSDPITDLDLVLPSSMWPLPQGTCSNPTRQRVLRPKRRRR